MGDNGLVATSVDGNLTIGDIKQGLRDGWPEAMPLPELARHAPDEVTTGLDAVLADIGETTSDPFAATAARRTLGAAEW